MSNDMEPIMRELWDKARKATIRELEPWLHHEKKCAWWECHGLKCTCGLSKAKGEKAWSSL